MKKLSLPLFMLFGFLVFSMTLQAQTTSNVKAEKSSCQKPCTKATQANNYVSYFTVLAAAASEEKASTPDTNMTKEKANCQKICAKKMANKANCDPRDCPPECLPPNCKIVSCAKGAKAVAVNQKPSDQN